DFGGGLFQWFLAPGANGDVDAFAGKRARDRLADSLAGASDDRFLVLHRQVHNAPPVLMMRLNFKHGRKIQSSSEPNHSTGRDEENCIPVGLREWAYPRILPPRTF